MRFPALQHIPSGRLQWSCYNEQIHTSQHPIGYLVGNGGLTCQSQRNLPRFSSSTLLPPVQQSHKPATCCYWERTPSSTTGNRTPTDGLNSPSSTSSGPS